MDDLHSCLQSRKEEDLGSEQVAVADEAVRYMQGGAAGVGLRRFVRNFVHSVRVHWDYFFSSQPVSTRISAPRLPPDMPVRLYSKDG